MPRRVDSPDDTVSSWTNRRKDLRVTCPAAATAGFFFSAEYCKDRLQFDRRIHPIECFASELKKIVIFAGDRANLSEGNSKWETDFRSLHKLFEFLRNCL